ncbi:TetR/AcrR family transcriptional regulator [Sulfobacillus harzensis]|uniref:TetR/AcrR family transcriptional regulator n=1 Tax=Sulfobacillus harzensis TaxID=2729629 RepID=A0A7Y0Q4J9_9FIRM|nr:TetR/AcrR family transcriptional regulator [Sulfobacillus harzensis]NMP24707.1 TetR/AcrR family transcriptional regulator [Sulfobacillus harzensis]
MPRTESANQAIRERRQAQIRSVAARLFAHQGYVGTRIDEIAHAVAMSKGLLYHYFGSKEELYTTLVDRASRGTVQLFEDAMRRPGTAADRLRWLVQQIQAGLAEQPDMFMVVMQALVSDAVPVQARDQAIRFTREAQALMGVFIREGQQAGDVIAGDSDKLALLLGSCIQGLAVSQAINGGVPAITDTLITLFTGS